MADYLSITPDRTLNPLRAPAARPNEKGRVEKGEPGSAEAKLWKAAQDFEAVFMGLVLKQMRSTVHREGLMDGGLGEEFFTELMDEELAKGMRTSGIADMLYTQLKHQAGIDADSSGDLPEMSDEAANLHHQLLKSKSGSMSLKSLTTLPGMP